MEILNKKYTTKNGEQLIIRLPEPDEAQALIDLKRSYIKDTKTLPWELFEYKNTEQDERDLIKKYAESENSILLVAAIGSTLVGNIDLTGNERKKMFHTAVVGMGIDYKYQNLGVGTYLMKEVLDWAKNNSPIELVWLEVYASNDLGLGLYKKMNFKTSGVIKGFFKEGDQYFDKIQMYQRIK